jgi:hypothetical protein
MKASALFAREKNSRFRSRSQAVVEFAIILPLFMTFMCGIIDYGYMIGNSMVLAVAAREGASSGARQIYDPLGRGLSAAVMVSKPRLLMTSTLGGAIITKVSYYPGLSTTYAYLSDEASISCLSTGSIYGGGDTLKNKSRILSGTATSNTYWMNPQRLLSFSPSVLDATNQSMIVMEVFYTNRFLTPIGSLLKLVTPPIIYDVAYF